MKVWQPWETAWPAGLLALGLGLALVALVVEGWRSRGAQRSAAAVAVPGGLFVLALVVRLVGIPALSAHVYDGHEAEYWDIFRGVREVGRGGTVLYPSMQWLWWGLGRVLPHHPGVPVGLMAAVGAGAAALVGSTAQRLGGVAAGLLAGLVVALHPVHAAWSSSAYNVILPAGLGCLSLWATTVVCLERRPSWLRAGVAVLAAGLAVLLRLETVLLGPVLLALPAVLTPAGMARVRALRRLWPVVPLLAGVGLVVGAGVWPLVVPGEVPGAGERALSFCINWSWLAPFWPLDGLAGLALIALAGLTTWRRPGLGGAAVVGVVWLHLVLASFDDYADRHALMALPLLAMLAGLAAEPGGSGWRTVLGRGLVLGVLVVELVGLVEMRARFYAEEDRFIEHLEERAEAEGLPLVTLAEARRGGGTACAWVNEDGRAQAERPLSHFNLIDPDEVAALRAAHGCIRWCQDVQDWRWSSRGVRDRAWRTRDLYSLRPVAVVTEQALGYGCLVVELGARRRCGCTGAEGSGGGC